MLEVEAIDTYRGAAQILQRVSLKVGDHECVCLVGRNGAGKTTTIDSVIGLLPIRSGKISFQGEVISRLPSYQRARRGIGYAPEDAGVFPDLTVAENIEICRWLAHSSGRTFFFSSRRRHTRSDRDWSSTCALPICAARPHSTPIPVGPSILWPVKA